MENTAQNPATLRVATIEEALMVLDNLVQRFAAENNPVGYFTAIYKKTTQKVHDLVQAAQFKYNDRMSQMDVCFVNLYLEAIACYLAGRPAKSHWQVAFDAAQRRSGSFSQHFLASANAHINYDLALASICTFPGEEIHLFQEDFDKMNEVLGSLYNTVNRRLSMFWPLYRLWMRLFRNMQDHCENYLMQKERGIAWQHALNIARAEDAVHRYEAFLLHKVTEEGLLVAQPRLWLLRAMFALESLTEIQSIGQRIRLLDKPAKPTLT